MNKSALPYINTFANIVIAFVFLLFPVFFLTITTDFFTFPKQLLIVFGSLLLFVLWGVKSLAEKKVTVLSNPLNFSVFLFILVVIFSTIFSASRHDSLLQMIPVALLGLFFFAAINFIQDKSSYAVALMCLIIGTSLSAILSIFAKFGIYALPFEQVNNPLFNTFGAPVQYFAFLTPILVLCVSSLLNIVRDKGIAKATKDMSSLLQIVATLILVGAIAVVVSQILTSDQKPILLPMSDGFQIAFASISQDAARLAQSLLVGSGYGTFATDFTRFVAPTFNTNNFWNLTFSFSSSYVLELLTTIGVLGLFAFAFIFVSFVRSKKSLTHPLFLATASVFVLSLIIPFSYAVVFQLFGLLALYVAHRTIENAKGFENVEINLVALKRGFFSVTEEGSHSKKESLILPVLFMALSIATSLYIMFSLTGSGTTPRKGFVNLVSSDIKFAKSLTPASLQNGVLTYDLQTAAISQYPYRSDYYRLFSQINLAIAANLVNSQQGKTPSQEVQQNIIGLLQQSINSGRQSVTLSPYTSSNWQNLGQIYRNLIGVGQNAEQFAIASYNQAIALFPANPGLRIELGGIYYQLQQWDLALNQFNIATQLKVDYANAYYNIGKTYEQKVDLQAALTEFQRVKQLVANDKPNTDKINEEIRLIEEKIGQQAQGAANLEPSKDNTPLRVNNPAAEFPERDPREPISPPPPTPAIKTSITPAPQVQNASPTPAQ